MTTDATPPARPLAAVTGGSSAIGREIAHELVGRGYDLVLAADDAALDDVAARLRDLGADVTAVRGDLRTPDGVAAFHDAIARDGDELAVLVLNAGIGRGGPFLVTDITDQLAIVDLTVVSTLRLARMLLPGMVEQGAGRVLVTSSDAADTDGPLPAVHHASTSFLRSWAEGLQAELADTPVTLTIMVPGPPGAVRPNRPDQQEVGTPGRDAVEALFEGKRRVSPGGVLTRLQGAAVRITPERVRAAVRQTVVAPAPGTDHG